MKKKLDNKNIKLTLKNVRCFSEEQHFNIHPLTFLVGENSTGKTTVMGCFNAIANFISRYSFNIPDFNREPYLMGSFQDIITKKSGFTTSSKNGENKTFEIGFELNESYNKYKIHFIEGKKGAQPVIQKMKVDFKAEGCSLNINNKKIDIDIKEKSKNKTSRILINTNSNDPENRLFYDFIDPHYSLRHYIIRHYLTRERSNHQKIDLTENKKNVIKNVIKKSRKIVEILEKGRRTLHATLGNIVSLAPIRSKPKRTYDPIRETPNPEGSEIPVTLMKLSNIPKDWKSLHKKLIQFGKTSGLFSNIKVKKYGKSIAEPFQLQFQIRGFQSNIMDIGYGVSQILPLLVRLFFPRKKSHSSTSNRFLLQQPEVHLHPKAQTELSSVLIENIKEMNNSFLIETHSDYMIDRARIEIRKKRISPDDVSLIYLESIKKGGVKAHNLSFDKEGNLKKAPKGYRDFFIKESHQSLGFED